MAASADKIRTLSASQLQLPHGPGRLISRPLPRDGPAARSTQSTLGPEGGQPARPSAPAVTPSHSLAVAVVYPLIAITVVFGGMVRSRRGMHVVTGRVRNVVTRNR